ncbi:MAG: PhoPQ-activated protein PqaA family protein [Phycisphaerae bacterium]
MKSLITICLVLFVQPLFCHGSALDDYVAMADPCYSYTLISSSPDSFTQTQGYTLKLVSQQWRTLSEVDHTVWNHWMTVVVPNLSLGATRDAALILIDGGNYTDSAPGIDYQYRWLAATTRSVIVILKAVPNQPLHFLDESIYRTEDQIVAYSWRKFLDGGDANWPVQLPMVKSVVRCMDATVSFVGSSAGGSRTINHFVLTGGSKRGWTAWLTAAVDTRVTAVAPIVSDLLNMKKSFSHEWASYGFWAIALQPYVDMGIFEQFETPRGTELINIVDPYAYRDRLTMPKFIINAAGDNFFVSDNIQFYFSGLSGEKHLRHVPNTDHYLSGATGDVFNCMVPFYNDFLNGTARPQFSWAINEDGSITVQTTDAPKYVYLWQITNQTARDFRFSTTGYNWVHTQLIDTGGGIYTAQVTQPQNGWTAFFVELAYTGTLGSSFDYHFTTEMMVLPEMLPYEADFNRDTMTNADDLQILADSWLTENDYREISPRRGVGDGIINFNDFTNFSVHWHN